METKASKIKHIFVSFIQFLDTMQIKILRFVLSSLRISIAGLIKLPKPKLMVTMDLSSILNYQKQPPEVFYENRCS